MPAGHVTLIDPTYPSIAVPWPPPPKKKKMGCRMGRQKETITFPHNNVERLDETLGNLRGRTNGTPPPSPTKNIFVAVEGVYSMDGDLAPLSEILHVAAKHGALVIVDEAHRCGRRQKRERNAW